MEKGRPFFIDDCTGDRWAVTVTNRSAETGHFSMEDIAACPAEFGDFREHTVPRGKVVHTSLSPFPLQTFLLLWAVSFHKLVDLPPFLYHLHSVSSLCVPLPFNWFSSRVP